MIGFSKIPKIVALVLLLASLKVSAIPPSLEEVILSQKIAIIHMEDAQLEGVISLLRSKATESLRRTLPGDKSKPVMIFELSFEPAGNDSQSKLKKPINYRAINVSLGVAMKKCLEQVGLDFRFVAENRIEILEKERKDQPKIEKKAEQVVPAKSDRAGE